MNYDNDYTRCKHELTAAINHSIAAILSPVEPLSLSEWAGKYAYLSSANSSAAGKFRAFKYQSGWMDAVTDPTVEKITVIKSARVGYSSTMIYFTVGYHIHHDPAPIMIVNPRIGDSEEFSNIHIASFIRDTPVLAALQEQEGEAKQKIASRVFPRNARIKFVNAGSPDSFRGDTIRILCFDEVDSYDGDIGGEGDPIALGTVRTETYTNSKIILGSTPTIKGASRIEKSWETSDQCHYHVPCPHCGEKQRLIWENLHWAKDYDEQGNVIADHPETAFFACVHNGCVIEETSKYWMIENGEWIADKPEVKKHRGYKIWQGYSLHPKSTWARIAEQFLEVKHNPAEHKAFRNTVLGETWEETYEKIDETGLAARAEDFDPDNVPNGVLVITAGIDTQDDRLEIQYTGWGSGEECWVLGQEILLGSPAENDVWQQLDVCLGTEFRRQDGRMLRIAAAAIDTGGHHTEAVYRFSRNKHPCRLFAIKGMPGQHRPVFQPRAGKGGKSRQEKYFAVGTDTAKDAFNGRIKIQQPGPQYIHFSNTLDDKYYKQLTVEYRVLRKPRGSAPYYGWERPSGARNEALDLWVYSFAALKATKVRLDNVKTVEATPLPPPTVERPQRPAQRDPEAPPPPAPAPALPPPHAIPLAKRRPAGWMKRPG